MAPKQPTITALNSQKKIFGISSAFWDIRVQNLEKFIFPYSFKFHNGRCTKNMNFQKVVFYTSDAIDSCSNYRIWGSGKVFL